MKAVSICFQGRARPPLWLFAIPRILLGGCLVHARKQWRRFGGDGRGWTGARHTQERTGNLQMNGLAQSAIFVPSSCLGFGASNVQPLADPSGLAPSEGLAEERHNNGGVQVCL